MIEEISSLQAVPGSDPIREFRLIFHIGAGKTGTSSIQQTLRTQQEKLKREGAWYLGLMLEHAPIVKFDWQRAGATKEFLKLSVEDGTRAIFEVLVGSIPKIVSEGCTRAIWSNEWFFAHGTTVVLNAVRQLSELGADVRIVAYVRRHDAWARSAYVQWGLKHKSYEGRLVPFDRWYKRQRHGFYKQLVPWVEAFGEKVLVRNLDAVGDAVKDFLRLGDIDPDSFERIRSNETPTREELTLRAMFNHQFKEKSDPDRFDNCFGRGKLRFDVPVDDWLTPVLPSDKALQEVVAESAEDRAALNELLQSCGQPPIDTTPLAASTMGLDSNKILAAVCQMVMLQAGRIQELEKKLPPEIHNSPFSSSAALAETPATRSSGAPVFLISTGRSGSTLVQRVLNCHRDLVVWGEHFGFLNGLASAYAQMSDPSQRQYPHTAADNTGLSLVLPTLRDQAAPLEWVNPWSLEEFATLLRRFIESYFASRLEPGQRWGFKEIRYNNLPALRMFRDLYPDGRFVFIRRDPLEVTRSKVFAFIKETKWASFSGEEQRERIANMLKEVGEHYRIYDVFMERNPGFGLLVDYEDLVAMPHDVTERMLEHLGLDRARYDWQLGEQVMASIITKTKRDDEVQELIRQVAESAA
jgi:hypothetical protein